MTDAGHSLAHLPQPTHFSVSTFADMPLHTWIADRGQTLTQHPQATQLFWSTHAFRVFRKAAPMIIASPNLIGLYYISFAGQYCDKITVRLKYSGRVHREDLFVSYADGRGNTDKDSVLGTNTVVGVYWIFLYSVSESPSPVRRVIPTKPASCKSAFVISSFVQCHRRERGQTTE